LSKHEGTWVADRAVQAAELRPLIAPGPQPASRDEALIRFLAAGEDWEAAGRQLSGAFADDEAARLRFEKEE
jgi:hypothetical protein